MKLTEGEIRSAQRMLARREKHAKSWRWARWLGIAGSTVLIGCGAYALWLDHTSMARDEVADLLHSGPATLQTLQLDRDAMGRYFDLKVRHSMMLSTLQPLSVFQIALGIWILTDVVVGWNRHVTDALLAKVLRGELARQETNGPDA